MTLGDASTTTGRGSGSPLGDRLRSAREAKGASTETASLQAGVPLRYLEMLEDGRFPTVADPAYLTHFLRRYAVWLGIDAEAAARDFLAETEPEATARRAGRLPPETSVRQRRPLPAPALSTRGVVVAIGLFVTLGSVFTLAWFQQRRQSGEELRIASTSAEGKRKASPAGAPEAPPPVASEPETAAAPPETAAPVPAPRASEREELPPPAPPAVAEVAEAPEPAPESDALALRERAVEPPASADPPAHDDAGREPAPADAAAPTTSADDPPSVAAPVRQEDAPAIEEPAAEVAVAEAPPASTPVPSPPPEVAAPAVAAVVPPFELQLTATARQVWVWLSVDGGPRQAVSLTRGETAVFRAEQGYVMSTDDAGGIEATLNGEPLPSLGANAQARRNMVIPSARLAPLGAVRPGGFRGTDRAQRGSARSESDRLG